MVNIRDIFYKFEILRTCTITYQKFFGIDRVPSKGEYTGLELRQTLRNFDLNFDSSDTYLIGPRKGLTSL